MRVRQVTTVLVILVLVTTGTVSAQGASEDRGFVDDVTSTIESHLGAVGGFIGGVIGGIGGVVNGILSAIPGVSLTSSALNLVTGGVLTGASGGYLAVRRLRPNGRIHWM